MKRYVVGAIILVCLGSGVAWATHVPQADPKDVPYGALAAGSEVRTPLKIKVGDNRTHRLPDGAVTYVRHLQLKPGESTGWHTHAGPALVTIVRGSLTLYDSPGGDDGDQDGERDDEATAGGGRCTSAVYGQGQGFIDAGFGHVHVAVAGQEGADFYQTLILPPEQGDTLATNVTAPSGGNCPAV